MLSSSAVRPLIALGFVLGAACQTFPAPIDPATAPKAGVDRFSEKAAHLMVRNATNGLPAANQAIDFDREPFITQGISPDGRAVRYYNLDVQSRKAAPVYLLYRQGDRESVTGQLPVFGELPGDSGYNDFRQIVRVTVPLRYKPNSITSHEQISRLKLRTQHTGDIVNLPIVPEGSTATRRFRVGRPNLFSGWHRGQVIKFFRFEERRLAGDSTGTVPTAPIFVTFTVNPDQPGGGYASGFMRDQRGSQTHNVLSTMPDEPGYSPLWEVQVYDNAAFRTVVTLEAAKKAKILGAGVATVNCPVVEVVTK